MSNNVIMYASPAKGNEKYFSTCSYPQSIKKLDNQIAKYRHELERSIKLQKQQQQQFIEFFEAQNKQEAEASMSSALVNRSGSQKDFEFLTGVLVAED